MRMSVGAWAAVVVGLTTGVLRELPAADIFRMETEVYVAGDTKPAVEYLTLFTESTIYDLRVSKPEELTIFDLNRNRIIVLDPAQKRKTTISTDEILQFNASIKAEVSKSNAIFVAAAHPQFETSEADEDGWFAMTSKHLSYRVKGAKPKYTSAVRRYQEFADWSARLSAMRLGNLPPFARIEVNKTTAEQGWIPEEVERVVNPAKLGQRKQEIRSTHLVNWVLSEDDRKKIEKTGDQLSTFREVSIDEFRELNKVTKK